MKIGVNLHNYGPFATKPAIDAIAGRAEALGYDSIWTADHILLPQTEPEPFGQLLETLTTLSYIAANTARIALGTSILVLPQREPILVAKQAATIDELSGGRLTLGIGVGWIEREFDYLGADFVARGDRADEYIAALRELWTAEEPRFAGDAVRFDEAILSYRDAGVTHIVIDPDTDDLEQYLDDLERFAAEVRPLGIPTLGGRGVVT
jgi:alkanesulfonate monooxygenase SsuD/methylene tetrahydromethanopterin reductase-like flavin-dependent oxidoreductase (luciferase family)